MLDCPFTVTSERVEVPPTLTLLTVAVPFEMASAIVRELLDVDGNGKTLYEEMLVSDTVEFANVLEELVVGSPVKANELIVLMDVLGIVSTVATTTDNLRKDVFEEHRSEM